MAESPAKPGELCHFELSTEDPQATQAFCEKIFGWKFSAMPGPEGTYHLIDTGGQPGGGMRKVTDQEPGPCTLNYILVEDLDAKGKEIEAAGGKVIVPRMEVPGHGAFLVFLAPGGVCQAIWEEAKPG